MSTRLIDAANEAMSVWDKWQEAAEFITGWQGSADNKWTALENLRVSVAEAEKALLEKAEPCRGVVIVEGDSPFTNAGMAVHCPNCNPTALRLAGELVHDMMAMELLQSILEAKVPPTEAMDHKEWQPIWEKARELQRELGG